MMSDWPYFPPFLKEFNAFDPSVVSHYKINPYGFLSQDSHDWNLGWQAAEKLMDEFAKEAMAAMISTSASPVFNGLGGGEDRLAKHAYEMAAAMMKARKEMKNG